MPAGLADPIDNELAKLQLQVRSAPVKDAVAQYGKVLKGVDPIAKRKALLFFADIQAKELLLTCLKSEEPVLVEFVASDCLGVFHTSDLIPLYKVTGDLCPGT
jgi:hypothetical protein